ncbi:T-complex protein 1 subunit theta-like [Hibiscus syriacus]|uniref:T-complex protein 1 subunit theta-like n=1 Tax=Hibiscus syriacus TaxID=106335 RepID=UPI0019228E5B|nr:T-complex protein 1 subunit theta-like [Hibiscus syriacus]
MVFVGRMILCQISSKFELRRFCRTTGTSALLKLSQLKADDLGFIDSISVEEIGGSRVTVVRSEEGGNKISTVLLRGSTDSILDDLERAVDDGVNTYKAMCRDSRMVPGATTTEIELVRRLKEFSFKETGLDQYAIAKFAESFEMVPRTLTENAGLN